MHLPFYTMYVGESRILVRKVFILGNALKRKYCTAVIALVGFVLWTLAVRFLDVRAIGPKGTSVGFSTINGFVRDSIGVCMPLYVVTDWLGLLPVVFMFGFATLGVVQWIRRKNFFKVDSSILILGAFYIVLALVYVFFEKVIINYRPVLIEGYLEASYPSSTTLLVGCVMPTSILQCKQRIQNNTARKTCCILLSVFTVFMVLGRLIAGVHWFTDIVGGALMSVGLVALYSAVCQTLDKK